MPWRNNPSPYRVWISEIMLQQTQVGTAEPYFIRFIERFPDFQSLATADIGEVIYYWSGLGYYSRARNLHKAAQMVVSEFAGELPDSVEALLKLPGIGDYTAGAIASIAFNKPEPSIDGNTIRVIARFLALNEAPTASAMKRTIKEAVIRLMPKEVPGEFNQALMELGSTICLPKSPKCNLCPLKSDCKAFSTGKPELYPAGKINKPAIIRHDACAVILCASKVFVAHRKKKGIWQDLWEFPHSPVQSGSTPIETARNAAKTYFDSELVFVNELPAIRHAVTKYQIILSPIVFYVEDIACANHCDNAMWATHEAINQLPLPAPHKKIAELVMNPHKKP